MNNKVSVISCNDYDRENIKEALEKLLEPFQGLSWINAGMKIAVKVNLVGAHKPEDAATPHPAVVCALTEMLVERGAEVVLGDSPGGLFSKAYLSNIYKATKMTDAVLCGASLNDDFSVIDVTNPNALQLKNFRITKYLTDADAVINLCKIKTHGLMAYTGACKNMYGAIPGMLKSEYHYRYSTHQSFADMLIDLCEYVRPQISIADAVVAMEGNGPSNGTPRKLGALIASENPHALDMAACHIIGLDFEKAPTVAAAIKRSLIPESIDKLDISGDIDSFKVDDFRLIKTREVKKWGTTNKSCLICWKEFLQVILK